MSYIYPGAAVLHGKSRSMAASASHSSGTTLALRQREYGSKVTR